MATKILFLDAAHLATTESSFLGGATVSPDQCRSAWKDLPTGESIVTLAPATYRFDIGLGEAFAAAQGSLSCVFFQRAEDAQSPDLGFVNDVARPLGVKSHLSKGSTIYSETFFNANGVGEKLDAAYRFAHGKLAERSLDAWASLQALLFLAIRSLPKHGEGGTGERVDVQVGADAQRVVYSVRFDLAFAEFAGFRKHAILELARACAGLLELRYLRDAKKVEVCALFPLAARFLGCIEVHSVHQSAGLDSPESAKEYQFQTFASLKGAEDKPAPKVGGFKKKFSEQVSTAPSAPAAEAAVPAPEAKVVVSGAASLGKKEAPAAVSAGNPEAEKKVELLTGQVATLQSELAKKDSMIQQLRADVQKANGAATAAAAAATPRPASEDAPDSHWENKLKGLEVQLKEKTMMVEKLSKDIEEIKDPSKRNVISGIKDNAQEALKQQIERLQKELETAGEREKEMLAVLDKAVQIKDASEKKIKELETKVRGASGGNNSKVVQLEKQLEEQKRQNQAMSKRVSGLIAQLDKAGIKPAA